MQFVRQIVGFVVFIAFLFVVGFVQSVLDQFGAPGIVSWPAAVIVAIAAFAGVVAGWSRMQTWRVESKPGVKPWKDLDDRAFQLQNEGKFAAAAPLFEQAVPLAEVTAQPIVIATAANNLAAVYFDLERWADARPLLQRAYEIRKQALGRDHDLTLATAERLTRCEGELGHWADVEALQRQVLPIYSKKRGASSQVVLETMHQIAVACRHQGNYAVASLIYKQEEDLLRGKKDLSSETAGSLYSDWAYLLVASGSPEAAIPLYDKAIAIREGSRVTTALATSLDNKADAQTAIGDLVGAAATSERWVQLMDELLNEEGTSAEARAMLAPILEQHAQRLDATGRRSEGDSARLRSAQIRQTHPTEMAKIDERMARMSAEEPVR